MKIKMTFIYIGFLFEIVILFRRKIMLETVKNCKNWSLF